MALEKQPSANLAKTRVTFRIPAQAGASEAHLVGEFNGWTPIRMRRSDRGGFEISLELNLGRSYRFRYLLDNQRWENDWQADRYEPNEYGGDDSVIDLAADSRPQARVAARRRDGASRPGQAKHRVGQM